MPPCLGLSDQTVNDVRASLVSATSVFALLVFEGHSAANPIMVTLSANRLTLNDFLAAVGGESFADDTQFEFGTAPAAVGGTGDQAKVREPASGQSPGDTYTYVPVITVITASTGTATVTVPNTAGSKMAPPIGTLSRRNPGTVSNLRGTIGSIGSGIFADAAGPVTIAQTTSQTVSHFFVPVLTDTNPVFALAATSGGSFVDRIAASENPGNSVFVGVRVAPGGRQITTMARASAGTVIPTATGAATATVMLSDNNRTDDNGDTSGPPNANSDTGAGPAADVAPDWSGRRIEAGPLNITRHAAVPGLPGPGAIGSTTLGYTYSPISRASLPASVLSAAMSVRSAGSGSVRVSADQPTVATHAPTYSGTPAISFGTVGLGVTPAATAARDATVDSIGRALPPSSDVEAFAIASAASPFSMNTRQTNAVLTLQDLRIPITVTSAADGPMNRSESLYAGQTVESGGGGDLISYALTAMAVLLPTSLGVLAAILARRAVLRRRQG